MDHKLLPLALISSQTRCWSTRVLVVEKSFHRKTKAGKDFQRYIFVDKEGTHIQAMSYSPDTEVVDRVLKPLHSYIISNAKVTPCSLDFRLVNNNMQWILTSSTVMELDLETKLPLSLAWPNFTNFSNLENYLGTTTNIDVIAIVVEKSAQRYVKGHHGNSTVQDLVLVTHEKKPIILSLWNDFIANEGSAIIPSADHFPIIAALRLRTQSFRGLSLSAKGSANIIVNPPYPAATTLQAWRSQNQAYLVCLLQEKTYFNTLALQPTLSEQQLCSIATIIATDTEGWFTVRGHIYLLAKLQTFYYMACPSYYKHTTASESTEFTCHHCEKKHISTPRAKFSTMISDNLTQLAVVVFGDAAETLLDHTASHLLKQHNLGIPLDIDAINIKLAKKDFIMNIRKKKIGSADNIQYYYNLSSFTDTTCSTPIESVNFQCSPIHTSNKRFTPATSDIPTDASKSTPETSCLTQPRKTPKLTSNAMLARADLLCTPSTTLQPIPPSSNIEDIDRATSSSKQSAPLTHPTN